jgi:sortase (surface protein transpeptidase)
MYNFIRENIDIINMIIQAIIGAVTAGALIVAIKNIKMNRDQYEDEKKNNSEKELKIQAEKIAAWFEEKRIPPDQLSKRRTQAFKDVLIRNNDLLPIYNMVA